MTDSPETVARRCAIARIVWAVIGAAALAAAYQASTQPNPPPIAAIYLAVVAFAWIHPQIERQPDEVDLEHLAHGGATEILRLHELNRLRAAFAQQKVIATVALIGALGVASPWFPAVTLCVLLAIRESYFRLPPAARY